MESPDLNNASDAPAPWVDAPGFLGRWRYRILLALVLVVPFFLPIPRVLRSNLVISELGDRLHVFLLGGATFFLYWYGPFRGRLLRSVVAAAALGGMIEGLQLLVGRHALWHDFYQDLIGIGIALGFVLWRGKSSRWGLALAIVLTLLMPWQMREIPYVLRAVHLCEDQFPVLADFEEPGEQWLWSHDYDSSVYLDTDKLILDSEPSEFWPGAVMRRFPVDWSPYRELKVDVRLASTSDDSVRCGLILTDFLGYGEDVWKKRYFMAAPEWRTISLPLQDREMVDSNRLLDLTDLFLLKIYLSSPQNRTVLEIDNLRLE